MMRLSREVEASYAVCRRAARRAGSNFYPAFLLLPGPKRARWKRSTPTCDIPTISAMA